MKHRLTAALALLIPLSGMLFGDAGARTWYVNVSGTGDAPTIEAALDSAAAGDSVLVGPGDYLATTCHTIPPEVVVTSEMGPLATRVSATGPFGPPCTFSLMERSELHGFWISGSYLTQVGTDPDCLVNGNIIDGRPGNPMSVTDQCTISNNLFLDGKAIFFSTGDLNRPFFLNNIVLCPIECTTVLPFAVCNDLLDLDSPCVQTLLADPTSENFSADPQFCGVEGSGNYYLQSNSPCAEGNTPHLSCGQVGPLPVACGPVSTENRSWGEIKAMYRE